MGALPHEHGTTFRVWAPAATAVALVGPFNQWDATTHPLNPKPRVTGPPTLRTLPRAPNTNFTLPRPPAR
ncbi:hypothetical protein MUN84_04720 [Hymenobacter sp. 5516J-16]|uniref:hypothetical protein n=1 Tax=Hymenobacter sp. 5516J-16 TaxID=2932253 RepID=UPI001FD0ED49|nr:hypothetical protein [Hymenobacter sp. 5516J-16]UOQ79079.1 hypothetical protein MUN84_04720 [Hymenobacter sp. 5516J-16]